MSVAVRLQRLEFSRLVEQAQELADLEQAIADAASALPADAPSILSFFEVPSGDAFDVKPEEAIAYFTAKKLKPTFSYADMMDDAHDHAFTVAKMMDVDMLGQVRASMESALANGVSYKQWRKEITPILQSGGWWGKQQVVDPLTGQEVVAQLGSPWRLQTIFRTNMQTAYAAGAWQEIETQKDVAPYLMYDSIDDFRTRPLHRAWDRTVLPVDDDWWFTHYPPNGYNCRCGVIQLSQDELAGLGIEPNKSPPKSGSYDWTNPRTGEELKIPNGIDPGFTHNAGKSWKWKTKQLLQEKIDALQADMRAAAKSAKVQAQQVSNEAVQAAKQAQEEVAKATAQAALQRAKLLAEQKAKEWAAAQQVELIAKGKPDAIGKGAAYKVKALQQLKKGDNWANLKPSEQLQAIDNLAADFKLKTETASKLSVYKKAILEGKTPPPNTVKAFQSLPEADQQALLAKIDAEKAAIEAKKAAEAAEAAKKAAGAEPSAALQVPEPTPPNPDTMVVIGRKTKGGTQGALYQDTATGNKYMVKFNGSEDAVLNEVLAARLYNLAGVEAPELHSIVINGQPALASRIVDGIAEVDAATLARTASVQEGFAVDAWLANWDSVGMTYDNTVLVGGRALRIDVGGSLRYRALGGLKGQAWGRTVGEIDSLRDGTNAQAARVFGNITPKQLESGVEKVLRVRDADIRALVEKHGPRDAAERAVLADTLIARKADLARRYPAVADRVKNEAAAASEPPPPPPRVTAGEQQFIDDSRVNGYGMATDGDQIEDHMVVVSTLKRADGSDATRGWFKLRPEASKELLQRIGSTVQGADPGVSLTNARDRILAAVKSINYRADKGQPYDNTTISKAMDARSAIDDVLVQIKARSATGTAVNAASVDAVERTMTEWRKELDDLLQIMGNGGQAAKLPKTFPYSSIPDTLDFVKAAKAQAPAGLAWRKVTGEYEFNVSTFNRSFATETARTSGVYGADLRYEATLPDGTTIIYFPHTSDVVYAMQGVVKIDAPGAGSGAASRVFDAIGEMGVDNRRATELDRKHLYLNAYARLKLTTKTSTPSQRQLYSNLGNDEAALQEKLFFLKKATGVDIEASDGWRSLDGVRQAFGHGRAYQLRPDLTPDQVRELGRTHVVYHNPQGLGSDAGARVFEKLKPVLEGGGVMAALTDRVRRGVPLAGSSVSSDLGTGGGDYLFTRIKARIDQTGTGVYWRTNTLRRMDAITYDSDQFGETKGTHIENNRLGQDVDSFRRVSQARSNETIFKAGLSLFDDLDRIVLASDAEVSDAIKWMQSKGYKAWPDGRPLDEVIITKAKHGRNP